MAESELMRLWPVVIGMVKLAFYASKIAPLAVVVLIGVALFGFRGGKKK